MSRKVTDEEIVLVVRWLASTNSDMYGFSNVEGRYDLEVAGAAHNGGALSFEGKTLDEVFIAAADHVKKTERIYPCANCNKMRTKAEGGTTFVVCDDCWDKSCPNPGEP